MCGFVISIKAKQDTAVSKGAGRSTLARGPDAIMQKTFNAGGFNILIEFAHLFITQPQSYQPLESDQYVLALNGEIYNYRDLAKELDKSASNINDTQAFFYHIVNHGLEATLEKTNGMYAGVLIYKDSGRILAFTDHIGKKPLLIWNSDYGCHIGTGIDMSYIDKESSSLFVLAPGMYDVAPTRGSVNLIYQHKIKHACNTELSELLRRAVSMRVPKGLPFSVALSGGLDSAILTYIIEKQLNLKPEYFVIGEQLPDSVIDLMAHLGINRKRVKLIKPSSYSSLKELIAETCRVVKSYNPSIVSNGLATMMLSKAVHDSGYRVLLGGEGADEFFCGYQAMYNGKHCPETMRSALIADMHFTELRRLDLISSHYAVEARCPFLDNRVTQSALSIAAKDHCNSDMKAGKIILRNLYRGLLPNSIINAQKEPFDITSGLQRKVIDILSIYGQSERQALKTIFNSTIGVGVIFNHDYFSKYPVFDTVIDQRQKKYQVN